MSDGPLEALLERLSTGDDEAIGKAFRACEPYLRMVVRRRLSSELRAKFDSLDVVQSVWVHAIKGFRGAGWRFESAGHLRAFLVRLTRDRLIDRFRKVRRSVEHERPLEDASMLRDPAGPPGERLDAEELWARLLLLCPPGHREILRHKRNGATAGEVARLTGLNEGSVRRILNALAGRLAKDRGEEESRPEPEGDRDERHA
jgi:RNA polymerase sigma-70 factor (ECF subfamily)